MKTRAERYKEIKPLADQGLTRREIADTLGISLSHVGGILSDPDGRKDQNRKDSYRGTCEICAAHTSGGNGKNKAPKLCQECFGKNIPSYWTKELVIERIQEWNALHGEPPKSKEWLYRVEGSLGYHIKRRREEIWGSRRYPSLASIQRLFGSWSNALEAAGFQKRGPYERTPKLREKMSKRQQKIDREQVATLVGQGLTDVQVAARIGCTPNTIGYIRRKELGISRPYRSILDKLVREQVGSVDS